MTLQATGIRNFRDVASHPAVSRYALRKGTLFRSAALEEVEGSTLHAVFQESAMRRVVDIRETHATAGDAHLPRAFCALHHVPLFDKLPPDLHPSSERTPQWVAGRYMQFVEAGRGALVKIMELAADRGGGAMLVHCSAGRDRTGIVIACILDQLGVDDQAIAEDYALSRVMDHDKVELARPQNMHVFLACLRDRYGSVAKMLVDAGAPDDITARLRGALLDG